MTDIRVPKIMCEACCEKIKKSLQEAGIQAEINLRFKLVTVADEDVERAKEAIQHAGYEVE